jgi:hypothetical protein
VGNGANYVLVSYQGQDGIGRNGGKNEGKEGNTGSSEIFVIDCLFTVK